MQVGFNFSNQVLTDGTKAKLNNNIKMSQASDSVSFTSIENKSKNKIGETFVDGLRIKMEAAKEKKEADKIKIAAEEIKTKMEGIKELSAKKYAKAKAEKVQAEKLWKDYAKLYEQLNEKDSISYTDESTGKAVNITKTDKKTVLIEVVGENGLPTKVYKYIDEIIYSVGTNPHKVPDLTRNSENTAYDELIKYYNGNCSIFYENYEHNESYIEDSCDKSYYYSDGQLCSYTVGENNGVFGSRTDENFILNEGQLSLYEKNVANLHFKDIYSTGVKYIYKNGELTDAILGYEKSHPQDWFFTNIDGKYNFENGQVTKIVKGYGAFNNNSPCRQTEYIFKDGKLEGYNQKLHFEN